MATATLPKVLCVDGEPALLRSMRWLFRGKYEVTVASRGMDAVALLGGDSFDVIICDQRMPDVSGVEVLGNARRLSPRTVRLLLTGDSDVGTLLGACMDGQAFRFIAKPWDNDILLATVDAAVGLARATQAPRRLAAANVRSTPCCDTGQVVLVFGGDVAEADRWREALQYPDQLLHTHDIAQAIEHLTRRPVAVLITELQGKPAQQLDLVRAVRRHLPQVVVVGERPDHGRGKVDLLIREGHIHQCVARSASPAQLRSAMRSAIDRHRRLQGLHMQAARQPSQVSSALSLARVFACMSAFLGRFFQTLLSGSHAWLVRFLH